jgi:dsDNA-specific endonuclease/ATPase MutS2
MILSMDEYAGPVRIPITGELDLHTFRPADAASVVEEYLAACRGRGLASARIIHGKGTGALRATIHALLRRSPLVESFRLGDETSGGWGATVVQIKPPAE